jgi:hypothetical protein
MEALNFTPDLSDSVAPDPAVLRAQLPPNSEQSIDLSLKSLGTTPPLVEQIRPLVLEWTATQELSSEDPQVVVDGKLRLIVDVHGERLSPSKPVVVDHFVGADLAPGWFALGSGGYRSDAGHFTLSDDPSTSDPHGCMSPEHRLQFNIKTTKPKWPEQDGCWYTDGKGVYTQTTLWNLPSTGIFRDIPPDSFDCRLHLTDVRWGGDTPVFRWEFWDNSDETYHYGPKYLTGVLLQMTRSGSKGVLQVLSFDVREPFGQLADFQSFPFLPDSRWKQRCQIELPSLASRIKLRVQWRESWRAWRFSYGLDDEEASRPVGEYVEASGASSTKPKLSPSSDGKRNLIYVRQSDKEKGFSVSLEKYTLHI